MRKWHKILGIILFILIFIADFALQGICKLNLVFKSPPDMPQFVYATANMLQESVNFMYIACIINFAIAIVLFIILWKNKNKQKR